MSAWAGPSWNSTWGSATRLKYQAGGWGRRPWRPPRRRRPSCSTLMSGVLRTFPDFAPRLVKMITGMPCRAVVASVPAGTLVLLDLFADPIGWCWVRTHLRWACAQLTPPGVPVAGPAAGTPGITRPNGGRVGHAGERWAGRPRVRVRARSLGRYGRACGREDSNLHPRRDRDLNPARLPIPPRPRALHPTEGRAWAWVGTEVTGRPKALAAVALCRPHSRPHRALAVVTLRAEACQAPP